MITDTSRIVPPADDADMNVSSPPRDSIQRSGAEAPVSKMLQESSSREATPFATTPKIASRQGILFVILGITIGCS